MKVELKNKIYATPFYIEEYISSSVCNEGAFKMKLEYFRVTNHYWSDDEHEHERHQR